MGIKLKPLPVKSGTRQAYQLFPFLLNIFFEIPSQRHKARRRNKRNTNGKDIGKLLIFADNLIS
jgi:hypothetical protein